MAAALTLGHASAASAVDEVVRDGSTSTRAAASCWELVQATPGVASGVYWLQTPELIAPQQFYCDMTTDGGGWVLVGRGRQGWNWAHNGQGQPSDIWGTPSGTAAFTPAALPAETIDGLLGGQRLDALTDGIRVVRAKDVDGTAWQELRLRLQPRDRWTWSFGGGIRLSSVTADGIGYAAASTQSWTSAANQQYLRMTTTDVAAHNYQRGFAFGNQISGFNNATSYLWEYSTENMAIPFAQVFIRPRVTSPHYPAVAPSGTPASTVHALMQNTTESLAWGVSGVVGGGTGELNMEVEDIAFVGQRAFVGGKFQYVQKGANPAPGEKVEQSYLAAFDIATGEWISTFRPVLNGMVWALTATPDGRLIVGGQFSSVNGAPNTSALAALDPITGALVPGWQASVTQPSTNAPIVRGLDVQGGWIYVGGRFSQIVGGSPLGPVLTLSGGSRVSVATGAPDPTWKPHFDGGVYELDASERGDRVYAVGQFDTVNFTPSPKQATLSTATGAALVPGLTPWVPSIGSGTKTYQQTILEVGDHVWQGGSEHILSRYSRDAYAVRNSNITRNGGDFQALAVVDGVVYASCHCLHYAYSETTNWTSPIPSASDVDNIRFIGAWDAQSGAYLPDFLISGLNGRNDMGPWALRKDPNGCLWFGGDLVRGSWKGTEYQWLGGFGKVCPRDTTAPTAPAALTAAVQGSGVRLTWGAASDAGQVRYEVLRDDRVMATTTSRTWTDPEPLLPAQYWVRAVDATGNRSASTPVMVVSAPDTVPPTATITSPSGGAPVWGQVAVTIDAADDAAIARVELLVDGSAVGAATQPPYAVTWTANAVGPHTLTARATDTSGNVGVSGPVSVEVPADGVAPSQVGGLTVTGTTATSVSLAWSPATDDRAVAGYVVSRDGAPVGPVVPGPTFTDTNRAPGTAYGYAVHAVDAAGNAGPDSEPVTATTASDPSVVFSDTFTAADGSAWSAPWLTSATNGSAAVAGQSGRLAIDDVSGASARAQLTTAAQSDADLLLSYRWSAATPGAYLTVCLRGSGGWQNTYRPRSGYGVQLTSSSSSVTVQKNVNGTLSTLRTVSGAQSVSTATQWLRLRVVGSTIQFRIWTDGQAEPGTWRSTDTDTGVTAAGQVFVSVNRAGANVGAKSVMVDDVTLRN
ncbi:MAG: fibrinogen-like YCDxxxxGGGW domain-containing protein [Kineosporiaceae bacterium]